VVFSIMRNMHPFLIEFNHSTPFSSLQYEPRHFGKGQNLRKLIPDLIRRDQRINPQRWKPGSRTLGLHTQRSIHGIYFPDVLPNIIQSIDASASRMHCTLCNPCSLDQKSSSPSSGNLGFTGRNCGNCFHSVIAERQNKVD